MNQDVRIDREGLQNIRTGERQTMILADELEVSRPLRLVSTDFKRPSNY